MSLTHTNSNQLLLFERIKNGDTKSFETIYELYWESLYIHILIMIEDEELAKDTIQELFIQLWNKRETLDISQNLKSYLYTSARNLVISKIRQLNRRHKLIEALGRTYSDKDFCTENVVEERDLNHLIDTCIDKLPLKMREVFIMSRKEYLTTKEIAERTGTAESTVKKQISNSLKFLRLTLGRLLFLSLILTFFIFFYNLILLNRTDKRHIINSKHEVVQ